MKIAQKKNVGRDEESYRTSATHPAVYYFVPFLVLKYKIGWLHIRVRRRGCLVGIGYAKRRIKFGNFYVPQNRPMNMFWLPDLRQCYKNDLCFLICQNNDMTVRHAIVGDFRIILTTRGYLARTKTYVQ